jgi:ribonuclease BN (tRNA processing enzyme)
VDGGASVAYVTDNELGSGGDYGLPPGWRDELVGFLDGVELMMHDAMYTPESLERHRGWGHSSYAEAIELAAEAGVGRLVLFHHRPEHDDAAMDDIVSAAQELADRGDRPVEVIAATEGMTLTL